ncbi:MAG: 3-deoxy-D-manno-octulosonic acid transferase [Syntrophales bacterium]|nr:3-deoxy-D-manno-octulosonic acid transferase [Syntrophales bacterium]
MSTLIYLYNALLLLSLVFLFPYFVYKSITTGKYRRNLAARLGKVHFPSLPAGKRVWIHAVSVGEVTAAAAIGRVMKEMVPDIQLILSTTTETGQEMARRIGTEAKAIVFFPLDFPFVVSRVLEVVRPDVMVLTETELWPNFLYTCQRHKIPVILVNGRISERSFRRYRATKWFWRSFVKVIAAAGMISDQDAKKIEELGVSGEKIHVYGNAKYDALATRVDPSLVRETRTLLNLAPEEPVFVAGSTHEGEEEIILSVYGKLLADFPRLVLILTPRHIERRAGLEELCRRHGFSEFITYREIMGGRKRTRERIIIVDVIGELFKLYGVATVVFCGGSLVPKGGQNVLEAAAWGKAPFFGPYMSDFLPEKELLVSKRGGIQVSGVDALYQGLLHFLKDDHVRDLWGQRARNIIVENRGAAKRYAELIVSILKKENA